MKRTDPKIYERMFCPRTLAVFGASPGNGLNFAGMFIKANLDSGFDGKIIPIGRKTGEIFGLKIYSSLAEAGGAVDLACVAVPAPMVAQTLRECLAQGVAAAEILTSGFGELGTVEGKALEAEIAAISREGLAVIGPNCFGIHCPTCGLTILPGGAFPKTPGGAAFIGQSGGLAVDLGYAAPGLGLKWRRMVSYGNACDLDAAMLLDHFGADPGCELIVGYIEGVTDGRGFFEAVRAAGRKKPLVLWKAGLTKSGSRAVMSHTGSLGGEGEIWRAAMVQAGASMVTSQEELLDAMLGFQHLGRFRGKGVVVIGGGGALGVAAADAADRHGFTLPELSAPSRQAIDKLLAPVGTSSKNPVDVGNPGIPPGVLAAIAEIALSEPGVDLAIIIQIVHHATFLLQHHINDFSRGLVELSWHEEMAGRMKEVRARTGKPVIELLPPISSEEAKLEVEVVLRKARAASHAAGVPTFPTIGRAFAAMERVKAYHEWRDRREARGRGK